MRRHITAIATMAMAPWFVPNGIARGAPFDADDRRVPMLLEIVLDKPTCVIHQNFSFKVRIVNPNEFSVQLRGFEMDSYIEPEVHLVLENGETIHLRHHPSDSAWTKRPVTIPPGGSVEKHRFLVNDNVPLLEWPVDPGVYRLQLKTHLSTAGIAGESERCRIEWDRPVVELHVQPAKSLDRRAWAWLEPQFTAFDETLRDPTPGRERAALRKMRIYAGFLDRFPESTYAPAIRWESTRLLGEELGNNRIPENELPEMSDLFERCLTHCLDRDGAFADDFVGWDLRIGGNRYLNLAIRKQRWALAQRIVDVVDRHHPDDEPGKMLRAARIAGHTKSTAAARSILTSLIERFPDSDCAEAARRQIENIDRGWRPPKGADEER